MKEQEPSCLYNGIPGCPGIAFKLISGVGGCFSLGNSTLRMQQMPSAPASRFHQVVQERIPSRTEAVRKDMLRSKRPNPRKSLRNDDKVDGRHGTETVTTCRRKHHGRQMKIKNEQHEMSTGSQLPALGSICEVGRIHPRQAFANRMVRSLSMTDHGEGRIHPRQAFANRMVRSLSMTDHGEGSHWAVPENGNGDVILIIF
jgi:hypothetical protein